MPFKLNIKYAEWDKNKMHIGYNLRSGQCKVFRKNHSRIIFKKKPPFSTVCLIHCPVNIVHVTYLHYKVWSLFKLVNDAVKAMVYDPGLSTCKYLRNCFDS